MSLKKQKNAIVTGATGAIGKAIARQLASKGFDVAIIARNEQKAKITVSDIIEATGNRNVSYLIADLSQKAEIKTIAESWEKPLHVLINDAGATPRKRTETPEGIEMQFATNVLGYFWMIRFFTTFLKTGSPSRVVNVASYWAGDLDISDLEFKRRHYNNDTVYRQSKQAVRMLTVAFAERLKPFGISVNASHPGDVNSTLSNNLGYGGHETPDEGADTPVWLATEPSLEGITGRYYEHRQQVRCRFGENKKQVDELFKICLEY